MRNLSSAFDFIDRYWLQFDAPSQQANALCAMFILSIAIMAVLGNSAVIYSFFKSPLLRLANAYVINMALSDVVMAGATYWMFVVSSLKGIWYFGSEACSYYAFVQGVCSLMSIASMTAIALERLYGVRHPNQVRKISATTKLQAIGLIWIYCSVVCLPPLFGWSAYRPSGLLTTCCFRFVKKDTETISYMMYLTVLGFMFPCCVIAYCYAKILRALQADEKALASVSSIIDQHVTDPIGIVTAATGLSEQCDRVRSRGRKTRTKIMATEIRTAKITLVVIITFMIAWTPYAALVFVGYFGPKNIVTPWPAHLTSMFAKACVLYNPIIYAFKDARFQRAFKKFILGVWFEPYRLMRLSLRYSMRSTFRRTPLAVRDRRAKRNKEPSSMAAESIDFQLQELNVRDTAIAEQKEEAGNVISGNEGIEKEHSEDNAETQC